TIPQIGSANWAWMFTLATVVLSAHRQLKCTANVSNLPAPLLPREREQQSFPYRDCQMAVTTPTRRSLRSQHCRVEWLSSAPGRSGANWPNVFNVSVVR